MIPRDSGTPQPTPGPAARSVGLPPLLVLPSFGEGSQLWLQPQPSARFSVEPTGGRVQLDAAALTCRRDSTVKD